MEVCEQRTRVARGAADEDDLRRSVAEPEAFAAVFDRHYDAVHRYRLRGDPSLPHPRGVDPNGPARRRTPGVTRLQGVVCSHAWVTDEP